MYETDHQRAHIYGLTRIQPKQVVAGALCKTNCNPYGGIGQEGTSQIADYINWEVQEQSFKKWNHLKELTVTMSPATFSFVCQMDVYYSTHTTVRD